jgi:hypothetical protein
VPPDDSRTVRTLQAHLEELTEDHFAYRLWHDERSLAEAEGSFVVCGFLVALAEQQQIRTASAYRWEERNRAASEPSGLYAEEFDVVQREMRGNLPKEFVHALMLETAARLATPWGGLPRQRGAPNMAETVVITGARGGIGRPASSPPPGGKDRAALSRPRRAGRPP